MVIMKKLLLLFATVSTLSIKAQTLVYHPFPDSNAIWNIYFTGCMTGIDIESYSILIAGDTLISGHTYHKLSTPFVQVSLAGYCAQSHFAGYKGAIRQDTLIKKVFFIPPDSITETLLYDFTMQVGDTVKGYLESWAYQADKVLSIDSIMVGNTFHKRWYINSGYSIYIIEGVGSTYGLIEYSPGSTFDFPDNSITCFSQNGQSLYPNTSTNCQLITTINSIDPISNQVRVFPNPSSGLFTVDFDQPFNIKEVRVTDLLGNIVFLQQTNNQKKIHIDNLPRGSYILTVIGKDCIEENIKIISCL